MIEKYFKSVFGILPKTVAHNYDDAVVNTYKQEWDLDLESKPL